MKQPSDVVHFGRYVLDQRIAVGGMAEVFLGHAPGPMGFEKKVVLKRILPDHLDNRAYVTMFLDEARLAARFDHPNLVHIYELCEESGQYGLVMEYLEGFDLAAIIGRRRDRWQLLPIPLAAYLVASAAEGLHHAHELRAPDGSPLDVVHRDVSPSNIILTRSGNVKVVDFGIARHAQRATETQRGVVKGKYSYMAPEQLAGHVADRRADVFALGVVLYELLTLNPAFTRENVLDTMRAIQLGDLRPTKLLRPDLPEALDGVVTHALAANRDARISSCRELARALRRALGGSDFPTADDASLFLAECFAPGERPVSRPYGVIADSDTVGVPERLGRPTTPLRAIDHERLMAETTRHDIVEPPPAAEAPTRDERTAIVELGEPPLASVAPPLSPGSIHTSAATVIRRGPSEQTDVLHPSRDPPAHREPSERQPSPPIRRWPAVAGLSAVLVAGAVAFVVVRGSGQPSVGPTVVVDADPAPERVAATPSAPPSVAPPEPSPMPSPLPVRRAERSPAGRPQEAGTLTVTCSLEAQVYLDGEPLGRAPVEMRRLAPGTYRLVLRNPAMGLSHAEPIRIVSREHVQRNIVVKLGKLAVKATPWADVFLGDVKIGQTPLAGFEVAAGKVRVRLVNGSLGVDRVVEAMVEPGKVTKVSEHLSAPP